MFDLEANRELANREFFECYERNRQEMELWEKERDLRVKFIFYHNSEEWKMLQMIHKILKANYLEQHEEYVHLVAEYQAEFCEIPLTLEILDKFLCIKRNRDDKLPFRDDEDNKLPFDYE